MSCKMSKMLSFLLGKEYGKMTDREAKAWAEKEAAEEDLKREKAKVRWLCSQLELRDSGLPFEKGYRPAESWELLADFYAGEKQ